MGQSEPLKLILISSVFSFPRSNFALLFAVATADIPRIDSPSPVESIWIFWEVIETVLSLTLIEASLLTFTIFNTLSFLSESITTFS